MNNDGLTWVTECCDAVPNITKENGIYTVKCSKCHNLTRLKWMHNGEFVKWSEINHNSRTVTEIQVHEVKTELVDKVKDWMNTEDNVRNLRVVFKCYLRMYTELTEDKAVELVQEVRRLANTDGSYMATKDKDFMATLDAIMMICTEYDYTRVWSEVLLVFMKFKNEAIDSVLGIERQNITKQLWRD